jgi:putative ABC transport system permease protein
VILPRISVVPVLEGVGIALEALRMNKVRAVLTILGVAVGVFVVVAITAVVRGINESFMRDLEAAGPTSFYVYRRPINAVRSCDGTDETCPDRRNPAITIEEALMVERLPSIRGVTAHVGTSANYSLRERSIPAGMEAYTPGWTDVDGGDIYPGRSFTHGENSQGARVVILNEKLARSLFDDRDPMDKVVFVNRVPMTVIGIYHYTASPMGTPTSAGGSDSPKAIIPYETARRMGIFLLGTDLIVKPRAGVTVDEASDDVTAALRAARKLKPGQENNFAIVTQDRLLEVYNQVLGTFFVVMISLASVGLLVGGVGVVGIMMISVTERTREIGVRKALGATRGVILWQFLIEAVTLTALGAVVGLIMGVSAAALIRSSLPIPASTPVSAVVAALGMSAVTGIVFGMLPAIRAARLDPVEALRHE